MALGPCLEWKGGKTAGGYGCVRNGVTVLVHRLVIEAVHGPIPEGMEVDHLCRNRACYRLDHLEVVTSAENTRRGDAGKHFRANRKTHCVNGHEYTEENTYRRPDGRGRACRKCRADKRHKSK